MQLRDAVTKAYVGATVVYDAALRRVTLDPNATLLPRRKYEAIVRSTITDLGGNPLTTTTWSFTTGS